MTRAQTWLWLGSVVVLLEIAGGQHCAQLGGQEGVRPEDKALSNDEQELGICPCDFGVPMSSGVYCLYSGRVLDPDGAICVEDAGVVWSSFDPQAQAPPTDHLRQETRRIFFGVASRPEIVLHAAGIPDRPQEATIHAYRVGEESVTASVNGRVLLTCQESVDRQLGKLVIRLSGGNLPTLQGCRFATYEGVFVGVLDARRETQQTASADRRLDR